MPYSVPEMRMWEHTVFFSGRVWGAITWYAFLLRTAHHNRVELYAVFRQVGDDNFSILELMIWAKDDNIHVMVC